MAGMTSVNIALACRECPFLWWRGSVTRDENIVSWEDEKWEALGVGDPGRIDLRSKHPDSQAVHSSVTII
jgi:hypothetical protein